jgi:DNA-binding NtrC family response regulator
MRMPGMDGATLLTHVMEEFPSTIRIMLTGYAEGDALARALPALHQLLNKPCDGAALRSAIEGSSQPATPPALSRAPTRPSQAPPRAAPRMRVLFIDDEPMVLASMSALLRRFCDVVTATTAQEALAHLRSDPTIQVVVSDMHMPSINGVALLAEARRLAPHTTRVLLTGDLCTDAADEAVLDGTVTSVLSKPCSRDELRSAMGQR